ncbi:MAG: transketolase [Leptospirales bacterium]
MAKNQADRNHDDIQYFANKLRKNIVSMVHKAKSGHPGGALGLADIYATLYLKFLKYDTNNPEDMNRDRFLLSNGHVCAVQYSALAQVGFFPEAELATFRELGSRLQGHPSRKFLPIIENSSGSLGQGLSQAGGVALGLKQQSITSKTFVCISDGECQEGMTWEAAMAIAHRNLDNIIAFVDYNNIQIDGTTDQVMSLGDLEAKFKSFGWLAKTFDGHNIDSTLEGFNWALEQTEQKPKIVLFKTVLGKGVSFMENQPKWHGSPPGDEDFKKAMAELSA